MTEPEPYYRPDLALVHHRGFGFHADMCAPGIIELLEPVRARNGLVLEVGCGSGLLTRYLVDAGLRVIATDASPAMLEIARETVPDAEGIERITLPDDPLPEADAVVSIGHALCYLPTVEAVERSLVALARALKPGGVYALDLEDLEWAAARVEQPAHGRVGDDWAIISEYSVPAPDRFVRCITTFLRESDGTWRRDDETHDNVMIDTRTIPALLATEGVDVEVRSSFGVEELPAGLRTIVGRKRT
jgi:SAM-dependent methyltransferase